MASGAFAKPHIETCGYNDLTKRSSSTKDEAWAILAEGITNILAFKVKADDEWVEAYAAALAP